MYFYKSYTVIIGRVTLNIFQENGLAMDPFIITPYGMVVIIYLQYCRLFMAHKALPVLRKHFFQIF